jgi:hypothetical protein
MKKMELRRFEAFSHSATAGIQQNSEMISKTVGGILK